jgi:hypothetical protein
MSPFKGGDCWNVNEGNGFMKRTVSQFDDDVQMGLDDGLPLYVARQRAIDNYRRYQAREKTGGDAWYEGELQSGLTISPDVVLLNEGNWVDANVSAEERMSVNEIFGLMVEFADEWKDRNVAMKWVARIIRTGNHEHLLSPKLQAVVEKELGDADIDFKADIAALSGYASRGGRRVPNEYEGKLREFTVALAAYVKGQTTDWYEKQGA